jgi:hypothetical protein
MFRWIGFLIAIVAGLIGGVYLGWAGRPPAQNADTTPNMLRADYKADYVLMVAEVYAVEGDLLAAARSLAVLGDVAPLIFVNEAVAFGQEIGYVDADQGMLLRLQADLQTWNPSPGELP